MAAHGHEQSFGVVVWTAHPKHVAAFEFGKETYIVAGSRPSAARCALRFSIDAADRAVNEQLG
jgi:hypothetical protein